MKTQQQLYDEGFTEDYVQGYLQGVKDEAERTAPIQRWEIKEPVRDLPPSYRCKYHYAIDCFQCRFENNFRNEES